MSNDNKEPVQLQNSTAIELTQKGGDTSPEAATASIQSIAPPIDKDDITRGKFEYPVGPGLKSVAPAEAAAIIESRKIDGSNIYRPSAQQALVPALPQGQVSALIGQASNTVQSPASIAELARALRNDVDNIFYHVYNNIEFHPNYGLAKGSLGCLIDGVGNAWDQSNLLVDLLRTAGYTANIVFGQIELTTAELTAWLGTDISGAFNAANFLSTSGIPNQLNGTFPAQTLQMSHCWVQVDIGGTLYMLDPSYKAYTTTAASINLTTATSYSQATLLTQAQVGATVDGSGNWIQNFNKTNIATELNTLSTNLVNFIKTNNPTATLDDVLGGRSINQISTPVRQTSLPYQKVGDVPVIWTVIPDVYKTTVRLQYPGIDITFFSVDIYQKRLTMFFNGLLQPVLALDGVTVATGTAQFQGSFNSVQVTITHPYAVLYYNQSAFMTIAAPGFGGTSYYLIGTSFGPTKKGMVDFHQKMLEVNTFAGGAFLSEPILGEQLSVVWNTYAAEFMGVADLVNRQTNTWTVNHHLAGVAGCETYLSPQTFVLDIPAVVTPTSPLAGDYVASAKAQNVINMHAYTLEQVALEQVTGSPSTSTTRILDVANGNGTKVYKGTNANFAASVRPNLTLYDAFELDNLQNFYLPSGYFCLIPETKNQQFNHFSGGGYAIINPAGFFAGIISGVYFGAKSGPTTAKKGPTVKPKQPEVKDPIQFQSGASVYRQTDLEIGSAPYPYSLSFESSYNSISRYEDGPLGLGWRHNWLRSVIESSDGFRGLGSNSSIDAAASIVETFVSLDLLADTVYPITKMMTVSLGLSWWSDQMSNNLATVQLPENTLSFAKLPDGSYNPQREDASTLAKIGGLFKHTCTEKTVFNFDALNNLSTIVHPFGVTITLAYTAGVLTSITNGLGRTLTLNYTGARLTSVTDGTGRSVGYTVDVNKQLIAIADALANSTTFQYDLPGRLWKYFLPENPANAVVVNTYDSLDRVQTQTDILGHVDTFYFAGWRSEDVDNLGNSSISFFNKYVEEVAKIDGLGNVISFLRDGLGRIERIIQPEGNYEEYTFDSSNNVLTVTKVAKSGSGLANIQLVNTYDPLWNKVATAQDGNGNITTNSYDPMTGNLLTIQRPVVGGLTPTVTNTWNARGQLLTSSDETSIVTQLTYDAPTEKLLTRVVDFGVGRLNLTTSYGYDSAGNVNSFIDPNLNQTTYLFDALRQLTQITAPTPFGYLTKQTFDKNRNLTKVERQTGGVPAWQTYSWTYSLSDQILTEVDPATNTTTRTFDGNDRILTITDAQLRIWQYAYDANNRISTVTDPSSTVTDTRTYSANGKLTSVKDARNNITQYTWDGFDRRSKIIYQDATFEQNSLYDAEDNVLTYLTRSGSSIINTFDALNRLSTKSPAGQPVVTATYDLANRLTQLSTPVVAGDPSSGAMQFFFDTAGRFFKEQYPDGKIVVHVLDNNGNWTRTTWPDAYFIDRSFDQLDRLANIKLNGSGTNAVVFAYNQLSQRTQLTFSNGATVVYTPQLNEDVTGITHNFVGSSVAFSYGFNLVHEPISQALSDSSYVWHPTAAGTTAYAAADNVNKYPTVGGASYSYNGNKCLTGDGVWTYGYDIENHLLTASNGVTSASFVYDQLHRQSQKTVGAAKSRYIYSGWQRIADYDGVANTLQNRYVYGTGLDEPLIQVSGAGVLTFLHHDRMGSVVATSNSAGVVTNKNVFSPFGEINTLAGTTFGFTGQRFDSELGLLYFKRRYMSAKLGRFLQPDPVGYTGEDFNLYTYVGNSPLAFTDPMGLKKAEKTKKEEQEKKKKEEEEKKKKMDPQKDEYKQDGKEHKPDVPKPMETHCCTTQTEAPAKNSPMK